MVTDYLTGKMAYYPLMVPLPMCVVLQEDVGDSEEEEGAVFLDLSGLQQAKELQSEAVVKGAMQSTVDAQEWRLEVERVLPSLKVHVRQDNRVSMNVTIVGRPPHWVC